MAGAASAAFKASTPAKPTVKHMMAAGELRDQSRNIPRSTPGPTPFISVKPSIRARHSLDLLAAFKVSPTAMPTKISRKNTNAGALAIRVSPSAKPTIKRLTVKKPSPTIKPTKISRKNTNAGALAIRTSPKPTMKRNIKFLQVAPNGVQTPAQSYGIYGLGGYVPTPTTAPRIRTVPSGSPTPVPGYFTPRYPGEAGAGSTVTVPPVPTSKPATNAGVPASAVTIPYARGNKTGRGSIGTSNTVPLSDDLRYAGRGPGLVDTTTVQRPATAAPAWTPGGWPIHTAVVQPPASAPGPYTKPKH